MAGDEGRMSRRLGAVLLADMKDYSALMGEDEAHAIAGVDDIAAVFQDVVPRHGGTYEIGSGDRFFAIFGSAVEALEAALEIQRELAGAGPGRSRPLSIRIGIHLGEVVGTSFGPMGDSINIAARIQAIAEPGGISVSEDVYRAVRSRLTDVAFRDTGFQTLKNIRERIRVYAVVVSWRTDRTRSARVGRRTVLVGVATLAAAGAGWAVWRSLPTRPPTIAEPEGQPLVLGVMAVRANGQVPEWMSDFTRDGLNTVLSKQPRLLVYSRQKIDFLSEKRGLKEIEVAEQLGISKMVSASLSNVDSELALEVQIIDIKTGLIEGSHESRGSEKQLIEMQNEAAVEVMRSLKLPVDEAAVQRLLADRTNDRLNDYKLLTESMGGGVESEPPGKPRSALPGPWWARLGPRAAEASGDDEAAIRDLLERYRAALESQDIALVESLHAALPTPMRAALQQYFQSTAHLRVRFSKLDVVVEGDEALATFTRSDDFLDAQTGSPVHLEVRVSNVLTRRDGGWKILGLKKPS
jgi:adenylate cyclase